MSKKGLFITVEGPNGTGKTTFITKLCEKLKKDVDVISTKEPTNTKFGEYCKKCEGQMEGLSYAFLICADRNSHVEREIIPAINNGSVIISDRYIQSSLVYQHFDGVDFEVIWDLNKYFIVPNLSILLIADPKTIQKRLNEREEFSYFELNMKRVEEVKQYEKSHKYLKDKGFNCVTYYNENNDDLEKNIDDAYNIIKSLII